MEFSSFFLHLLFFGQIFQFSNTIVSSAKVEIPARNAPTDKLVSLTEQMDEKDADIGKRLVQQRMKRDTDDDTDDDTGGDTGDNLADDNEDLVYIDYRNSHCLGDPRNQGNGCHASYAFATIALYEWINCKQTGGFQAFSEQYMIDCGHRHGNAGCDGGNPLSAMMFVNECGLELRASYRYTGTQGRCPFDDYTPYEYMGTIHPRLNEPLVTLIALNMNEIEQHLEYGPIIVPVELNYNFPSYTRGVDNNVGHTPQFLNTMLLIGHGREDGEEYWLFRNSYGPNWGEHGHYKLNKNTDCLRSGGLAIGLSGYVA